ncbi:armadillo-like helical domain containing protein 1 isoform X3 [Engystomops pustulosus]|uniref:armadillo-like helical domain containing protein 1 isoform X3 n=1 Tax=Engystomops pustulosus TaxID=76066 RepID=UPI003AFAF310
MSAIREQEATSRLMIFLKEWDNGNKVTRSRILNNFITSNSGKTAPELEQEFNQGASLFLARLTTRLRLSYLLGTSLKEILQSVSIFLSASGSGRYKVEFVEVGGVLTLLEILGLKQLNEEQKMEALRTLQILARAGPKYKELICESYGHAVCSITLILCLGTGVRAVAECLAKSKMEDTQEKAQELLELLAHGNPRYQTQVYKGLIALLPCTSPKAQYLALQTLRTVQDIVQKPHPAIVEPLLGTLQTVHMEVQCEALQLIAELSRTELCSDLLQGLVALLRPSRKDGGRAKAQILEDPAAPQISAPLPVFIQQAASARAIGMLARESTDLCHQLIRLRVVHHLLYVMGNTEHTESQRQASLALEENPEVLYMKLDAIQVDVLVSNQVNVPRVKEVAE